MSGLPIAQRAYTYVPYREGLLVSTVSVSVGGRCFRELLSYYDQRIYWDLALLQSAVASRGRKKAARRIKTHTPPRIKIRLLMELRTRTTHSKPSTSHNRTANVLRRYTTECHAFPPGDSNPHINSNKTECSSRYLLDAKDCQAFDSHTRRTDYRTSVILKSLFQHADSLPVKPASSSFVATSSQTPSGIGVLMALLPYASVRDTVKLSFVV